MANQRVPAVRLFAILTTNAMGNSDSKSKFRESVYKLSNEEVSSRQLEFWDKLWKIPTTAEVDLASPCARRLMRA